MLSTGKAVLKWIGGGFGRFIENFKKDHMIKLPKIAGIQVKLPGIGSKIPNLLQLYNPMAMGPLLLKSFFPPSGEEGAADVTPAEVGDTSVDADAAAVSEETDYEKTGGTTVLAEAPTPPSGGGGGGGSNTLVLAASTKDVVNSYNKSVVTGQLSKI